MFSKRAFFSCVLILFLLSSPSFAQDIETAQRLENPTELPQNRLPITAENAGDIQLLAMWGLGSLSDVAWIDDRHLVIVSNGGAWLYDMDNPEQPLANIVDIVLRHRRSSEGSLVSPDGQWLALSPNKMDRIDTTDTRFGVWHLATGKYFDSRMLKRGVEWLADNRLFTAIGTKVVLWTFSPDEATVDTDLSIPRTTRTAYPIERIAVSPDSRLMAVAVRATISDQLLVQLWDLETGEYTTLYEDDLLPERRLNTWGIQFNQAGSEVALSLFYAVDPPEGYTYMQHEIWRWDTQTSAALDPYLLDCRLTHFNYSFDYGICQSSDSSGDTVIDMFRLSDGRSLADPMVIDYWPDRNNINANTHYLTIINPRMREAANISPYNLLLLDENGNEVATLEYGFEYISRVAISPDASRIAVVFENRVEVVEINDPEQQLTIKSSGVVGGSDLAISPDGHYLVAVGLTPVANGSVYGRPSQVVRWNLMTNEYTVIPEHDEASTAAYSPDGSLLMIGGYDGTIHVYDAATLTEQAVLFNDGSISDITFSHNGRLLAVANERYVRLWDVETQTVVNRVAQTKSKSLIFSTDDSWLVNGRVIWKLEDNGRLIAQWNIEDAPDEISALLHKEEETLSESYCAEVGLLLRNSRNSMHLDGVRDSSASKEVWRDSLHGQHTWLSEVVLTEDLVIALHTNGIVYLYGIVPEGDE
jgi:WD40 repeat protein